ncbi:hypothetical protein CRUP_019009, partial [Coryphaenoides rupestris]
HGHNAAELRGQNLRHVIAVRIHGVQDCSPKDAPVQHIAADLLTFHIPAGDKGPVSVCLLLPGGRCHGNASLTYHSAPVCHGVLPDRTWASGRRKMEVKGSNMEFIDVVAHNHTDQKLNFTRSPAPDRVTLYYESLPSQTDSAFYSGVMLTVANHTLSCPNAVHYLPDPRFTGFTYTRLQMAPAELQVRAVQKGAELVCVVQNITHSNGSDFIRCNVRSLSDSGITVKIMYGAQIVTLQPPTAYMALLALTVIPLILIVIAAAWVYCYQRRRLTARMNKHIEKLEMDIRSDIRQGFVEMQIETSALMENVGTIPFLDYKHFAAKIFFPEGGALMTSCLGDIGQEGRRKAEGDEGCRALSRLLRERPFLTSMVHALEEQRTFTLQHKCVVASLLTVALQGDLAYLTEVMEELLRATVLRQTGSVQQKLLLRGTQSIVEKLLTNWMSVCLYGFLRVGAGVTGSPGPLRGQSPTL